MKTSPKLFTSLIKLAACAMLALAVTAQAEDKPNAAGTWTWTVPGRNGGADRKATLKLKVDGEQVTGTIATTGGQGGGGDTAIADGKLKGEEISFTVTREFNGNKFVQKYNGKVSGDSIKGKVEFSINGKDASRDWDAKREAAK